MKNSKKLLFTVLPAVLAVSTLVGCGERKFDLELKTTSAMNTVLERFADGFKKETGITVKITKESGSYSDLANKINDSFATGNQPDLAMVYPDAVADFIERGFAFDVEPYMNSTDTTVGLTAEQKADIIPAFLEEGTQYVVPGTYSMPMSKSTEVMYYSAHILNASFPNVKKEGETITITEKLLNELTWEFFFEEFCPSILAYNETEAGHKKIGLTTKGGKVSNGEYAVLGYDSDDNLFITLLEQYGVPYTSVNHDTGLGSFDFNNDEAKQLMYKLREASQANYIITAGGSSVGQQDGRSNNFFTNDQCLFSVGSTAGSKYQHENNKRDIRVARIPQAKGKARKVIMQGPSMAFLSHKDKNGVIDKERQKNAWLFYKYLIRPENALEWALQANYMPVLKSLYENDEYLEAMNPEMHDTASLEALNARIGSFVGQLTEDYYTSPAFKGTNESREQVGAIVSKAVNRSTKSNTEIDNQFKIAYEESVKANR